MAAPSTRGGAPRQSLTSLPDAPRLPSHMLVQGRRPQHFARLEEVEDEGDVRPQPNATFVSARTGGSTPGSPTYVGAGLPLAATESVSGPTLSSRPPSSPSDLTPISSAQNSPPRFEANPDAALAVEDNESATAALLQRAGAPAEFDFGPDFEPEPEPERLFQGVGRSIELFLEPLSASVDRFHFPYDAQSSNEEDPLLYYGVSDGTRSCTRKSLGVAVAITYFNFLHGSSHPP